jgi:hypothetical protein
VRILDSTFPENALAPEFGSRAIRWLVRRQCVGGAEADMDDASRPLDHDRINRLPTTHQLTDVD